LAAGGKSFINDSGLTFALMSENIEDAEYTEEVLTENKPEPKPNAKPHPKHAQEPNRSISDRFHGKMEHYYNTHYKLLAIIPLIIGIIALLIIFMHYQQTGDFMNRGISLKGGTTLMITLSQDIDVDHLSDSLRDQFPGQEFNIRALKSQGVIGSLAIETSMQGTDIDTELLPAVEKDLSLKLGKDDFSVNTIGSSLSESFFQEMLKILLFAFLLMGVVVFITFRSPVPSFYVILCAFFDMVITLAVVDVLGIKITTAGIAAFLMLINFSVDSDMLLTARILPKELHGQREPGDTPYQGFVSAFITGMTMTATVFAAVLVAYLFTNSPDIKQIMVILLIGLIVDMIATWLQNAALCRWYVETRTNKGR
jgi:preprotein translocase subunit SecF